MSGKNMRIAKLFKNKKNLVISALDHVMEYGDQPGIEDAPKAINSCMGVDALLLPRFMLKKNWQLFIRDDSPVPVIRINWSSSFYYPLRYRQAHTVIATNVEEAVEAGGEAIICSLFLENKDEETETYNVSIFSEVVRQKEILGIPLIGECYVVEHDEKSKDEVHSKVKRVSRIMTELGADMVKTFYTGEKFSEVISNTPAPVFTIGAEKLSNDLDVLKKAKVSTDAGARGIIFGRNIFMSKKPQNLIKALNKVINSNVSPENACKEYDLI